MDSIETTNTMNFSQFRRFIAHKIIPCLIWGLIVGVCGWAIARFVLIPKYTATVTFVVNQGNKHQATPDINKQQADVQMITTYKDLLTSEKTLSTTRNALSKGHDQTQISNQQLKKAIQVDTQQNSQVFNVSVNWTSSRQATVIANTLAKVLKQQVQTKMHINNLQIYSYASSTDKATFPNTKLFTVVGFILGFFLSFITYLLSNFMNQRILNSDFMTDQLGMRELGRIEHLD